MIKNFSSYSILPFCELPSSLKWWCHGWGLFGISRIMVWYGSNSNAWFKEKRQLLFYAQKSWFLFNKTMCHSQKACKNTSQTGLSVLSKSLRLIFAIWTVHFNLNDNSILSFGTFYGLVPLGCPRERERDMTEKVKTVIEFYFLLPDLKSCGHPKCHSHGPYSLAFYCPLDPCLSKNWLFTFDKKGWWSIFESSKYPLNTSIYLYKFIALNLTLEIFILDYEYDTYCSKNDYSSG